MGKFQPHFDFGWLEEEAEKKPSRPSDSVLFVAYIKQVVPQLAGSKKPIHKTAKGYATNSSPWSEFGQWEFDLQNHVIVHRHKEAQWAGDGYEYQIVETRHPVSFTETMMCVE